MLIFLYTEEGKFQSVLCCINQIRKKQYLFRQSKCLFGICKEFTKYLTLNRDNLADETDFISDDEETESPVTAENASGVLEFNFDAEHETPVKENTVTVTSINSGSENSRASNRDVANRFLRRLISAGWLSEETPADFSRVINITAWGRPFFEALIRVDEGLKTEYEQRFSLPPEYF